MGTCLDYLQERRDERGGYVVLGCFLLWMVLSD